MVTSAESSLSSIKSLRGDLSICGHVSGNKTILATGFMESYLLGYMATDFNSCFCAYGVKFLEEHFE